MIRPDKIPLSASLFKQHDDPKLGGPKVFLLGTLNDGSIFSARTRPVKSTSLIDDLNVAAPN
jgi:hypothetical protein